MTAGISVLCVDDDPDVRELTATFLERELEAIEATTAASAHEALERVASDGIDCVVSDYDMPGMNGLELLEAIREHNPNLPVILFTGKGSEEIASEAISAGVTDYLQKETGTDQYAVLANRIENVVERRRANRARLESERELEQYRKLVETAVDPMYVLDDSGVCQVANEALAEFLGVDRDRIVGEPLQQFVADDVYERGANALETLRRTDRERTRIEFRVERDADVRVGEALIAPVTDDSGEHAGSVTVIRDVSERKRREQELVQYEQIIELAPIALFILDEAGTVTWMNDEFADSYAESKEDLLGTPFPELVERGYYDEWVQEKYTDHVRELLSSKTETERAKYTVQFHAPDGETRIHDVHTELLPLEDGEFVGTIHAIRDITRRRRYQRQLERQNERLEQFASLVSHDLRNPLNVAKGNLELHAAACETTEGIEGLSQSLDRMDELIEDLLSLARKGRSVGEPDRVSLPRLVDEAWEAVETDDATLEGDVDGCLLADGGRARELLENLFRNAIDHGSPSPDSSSSVTVTVGMLEDEGTSGWYVADDGSGLPEVTDEIFEFGYTTSESGTGLGLAIVREIAEAHGWTITAGESDDGGARFEIREVTFRERGPSVADAGDER